MLKSRTFLFIATLVLYHLAAGAIVFQFRLDNGLRVVLAPTRLAPVVAVQAWVGVGSADEHGHLGIAHVFEHMLFKGTARRGVGEIARTVEAAGGDINAWTSFDQTVYHVVLASRFLDTGLDVLSDALHASTFEPVELEREREVILEEIRQGNDDPGRTMAQGLFATAFVRHPYRRPIIGTADSVRAIQRGHLLEFFRHWYVPSNMTLVVAGDFDEAAARARIERHFGGIRSAAVSRRDHREPEQHEPRATVTERDVSEAHLGIAFRIPPVSSEHTAALDVAAIALGQGESSRLQSRVRRGAELVTGTFSYLHCLRDAGLFVIGATCDPAKLPRAVEATAREIYRLGAEGIDADELAKARTAIEADAIRMRETAEGIARAYGYYDGLTGDPGFEKSYLERVASVTEADVQRAAALYLAPSRTNVSAVIPRRHRGRRLSGPRVLDLVGRAAARTRPAQTPVAGRSGLIKKTLRNGIRVIVKRDPSVPVVAARAVWTGGLRIETPETNGVSHLIAATITRGCGDLSAEEVIQTVDRSASSLAGFSGRNTLGVRGEWLARNWERGFELMVDCLLRPRFPAAEVARERRRAIEEIAAREDNPSSVAFRLFAETLYRKHPYRMDPLGTERSVSDLGERKLARFYRENYPLGELTLAVVGDVDPDRAIARIESLLGGAPTRKRKRPVVSREQFANRAASSREVFRYMDREQAHLVVGFPGATLDDPDRHALEVLITILGGQGGRLFVELRDRQALAYRVAAFSVEGMDPGYMAFYLACSPDKLGAAVEGIRKEVSRVVTAEVSASELERAVKYLVGTHDISLQRRSSVASAIAFHEAYGLGHDAYERYAEHIEKVTPADVQRLARRFFDWDVAVIATVMPPRATPAVERRIKRGEAAVGASPSTPAPRTKRPPPRRRGKPAPKRPARRRR